MLPSFNNFLCNGFWVAIRNGLCRRRLQRILFCPPVYSPTVLCHHSVWCTWTHDCGNQWKLPPQTSLVHAPQEVRHQYICKDKFATDKKRKLSLLQKCHTDEQYWKCAKMHSYPPWIQFWLKSARVVKKIVLHGFQGDQVWISTVISMPCHE